MTKRVLIGVAAALTICLAIGAKVGMAEPPPGGDVRQAFSVRPGLGSCVPRSYESQMDGMNTWKLVMFDPPNQPAVSARSFAVQLICPLDVGPGEMAIKDLAATVYGRNANNSEAVTVEICMFDLPVSTSEVCGPVAKSPLFGQFAVTALAPNVTGMSDRTAAYLKIGLTGGNGEIESYVGGFVVELP